MPLVRGHNDSLRGCTASGGTGGCDNASLTVTGTAGCGCVDCVTSGTDCGVFDARSCLSIGGTATGSVLPSYYQVCWVM